MFTRSLRVCTESTVILSTVLQLASDGGRSERALGRSLRTKPWSWISSALDTGDQDV